MTYVIAVDGIPAPDLGIFLSAIDADREMRHLRSLRNLRGAELQVVSYIRKRLRRAAA
ncbi:MAG TPA: hypothetical protein VFU76_03935 [Terriglobales bacterium]|nr:hypothetical protein [Terriglobales bacterium]